MLKRRIFYSGFLLSLFCSFVLIFSGCSETATDHSESDGISEESVISDQEIDQEAMTANFDEEDLDTAYDEETAVIITCENGNISIQGSEAETGDGIITITAAGTYVLKGELENGQIVVDADKEDMVHLVFSGFSISCGDSAAVYGKQSEKIIVTLEEGTENKISDGAEYYYEDASEDEPNAAFFSKDDITFNGNGILTVEGNYKHGINSKDTLKIVSGTFYITSVSDGIRGKDAIIVKDGEFLLTAGSDGIQSNNSTESDKGYIYLQGGSYNIQAENDGIQAETALIIEGGEYEITTSEGSEGPIQTSMQGSTEESSDSAKALKAGVSLNIKGGSFTIDSLDDSVHCNGDIAIDGGEFIISSGDDGIHADNSLVINDGTIQILKSYEGIEGLNIVINGGEIDLTASDDGLNAAGGNDASSIGGRPGQNAFAEGETSDMYIEVNGGKLTVDASGDGIDSNGSIKITGGETYISGPTDNGNGSLDYNTTAVIEGGIVIAAGSSGMAQTFSDSSSQNFVTVFLSDTEPAETKISLTDSEGNEILDYTPEKSYSCVVFSCDSLTEGETYKLITGETETEIEITGISTQAGTGSFGMGSIEGGAMRQRDMNKEASGDASRPEGSFPADGKGEARENGEMPQLP